jgi:hypothetical protein
MAKLHLTVIQTESSLHRLRLKVIVGGYFNKTTKTSLHANYFFKMQQLNVSNQADRFSGILLVLAIIDEDALLSLWPNLEVGSNLREAECVNAHVAGVLVIELRLHLLGNSNHLRDELSLLPLRIPESDHAELA